MYKKGIALYSLALWPDTPAVNDHIPCPTCSTCRQAHSLRPQKISALLGTSTGADMKENSGQDSAIPPLGMYPESLSGAQRQIVFTAAVVTVTKIWRQPTAHRWRNG